MMAHSEVIRAPQWCCVWREVCCVCWLCCVACCVCDAVACCVLRVTSCCVVRRVALQVACCVLLRLRGVAHASCSLVDEYLKSCTVMEVCCWTHCNKASFPVFSCICFIGKYFLLSYRMDPVSSIKNRSSGAISYLKPMRGLSKEINMFSLFSLFPSWEEGVASYCPRLFLSLRVISMLVYLFTILDWCVWCKGIMIQYIVQRKILPLMLSTAMIFWKLRKLQKQKKLFTNAKCHFLNTKHRIDSVWFERSNSANFL